MKIAQLMHVRYTHLRHGLSFNKINARTKSKLRENYHHSLWKPAVKALSAITAENPFLPQMGNQAPVALDNKPLLIVFHTFASSRKQELAVDELRGTYYY